MNGEESMAVLIFHWTHLHIKKNDDEKKVVLTAILANKKGKASPESQTPDS